MIPIRLMSKLKLIGYFLWDNKKSILIGLAILFAVIGLFSFCGRGGDSDAQFNENKIREDVNAMREGEYQRFDNNLEQSGNVVNGVDNRLREASANTRQAVNKDYSNTKGSELDEKAGNYR